MHKQLRRLVFGAAVAAFSLASGANASAGSFSITIGGHGNHHYNHHYRKYYGHGYGHKYKRPYKKHRSYRYYNNHGHSYKRHGNAYQSHGNTNYGRHRKACHKVSKRVHDGYGHSKKISGTMCYDDYGRAYIVPGSRYYDY